MTLLLNSLAQGVELATALLSQHPTDSAAALGLAVAATYTVLAVSLAKIILRGSR